jgi:endonuclease/exonuclease/phosphatase family metal-dependent hydrolase
MTNFVAAFLPGYHLAINSATDGFIRSAVLSRFPIGFSKSYLHSADLSIYGYTNSDFTRDLFQAQVIVPAFPQPLNVFVVHLKSGQDTDSSNKRGAEASAVSNFLATVFLATNTTQPYVLSGDMNEDIDNPPSSHPQSIQRLVNSATGLQLTSPLNPYTGTNLTFSIQSVNGLSHRYDYIMPSPLLLSNITSSQVFRTDLLPNPPPPLLATDDATASDHLPVYMVFANPYAKPFRLLSLNRTGNTVAMTWQSVLGQPYRLEASSNLVSWNTVAQNLMATGAMFSFSTNVGADAQFFRVYRQP